MTLCTLYSKLIYYVLVTDISGSIRIQLEYNKSRYASYMRLYVIIYVSETYKTLHDTLTAHDTLAGLLKLRICLWEFLSYNLGFIFVVDSLVRTTE